MSELRHALSLCAAALMAVAMSATAEPVAEPYRVWTVGNATKVFSGPGNDYYATQELPSGTECEVYEELRDGWLAIRPPQGSYSLVLRSALQDIDGDVARVVRDQTPSRVGSVLSTKYSSVHVRLDKGEVVQVIDGAAVEGSQWIAIAPPPGEFRWIRESDVALSPTAPEAEAVVVEPTAAVTAEPSPGEWQEHVEEVSLPVEESEVIRVTSHSEAGEQDEPAPSASVSVMPQATIEAPFGRQLNQLEIQLSRRVAGPVNLWVFDDLQQAAAQLLSAATTPAEEDTVRDLASRMGRFQALGKRYREVELEDDPTVASIATSNRAVAPDPALAQFDAVGVLRPVVSTRGNAPPYALVDDAGNVVTFVTPSPSLNLQQHLGQRVGVSGTRGFLPEYRERNIQTARVAPVGQSMTR